MPQKYKCQNGTVVIYFQWHAAVTLGRKVTDTFNRTRLHLSDVLWFFGFLLAAASVI
jgi:hypothetical protein